MLYPESNYDSDGILSVISQYKSIKKYFFILHDQDLDEAGNLKKPHYHVYLNFGKASIKIESVAKWFGIKENYVERVKGRMVDVIRYYTHEKEPEKHQYSYDDITANFDIMAVLEEESEKVDKADLIERCSNGTITRRNFYQFIDAQTYVKYQKAIESAWDYYERCKEIEYGNRRALEVIWIFGKTGTGKTTIATLFAEHAGLSYYLSASGKDAISDYKDEDVLILDDPRPDSSYDISEYLKMLDPNYRSAVRSRYKNKPIYAKYIIITNPLPPQEFFRLVAAKTDSEDPEQLYRRISQVWEVNKTDIIIRTYDEASGRYLQKDVRRNPVPEKVIELQIEKPKDPQIILSEIAPAKELFAVEQINTNDDSMNRGADVCDEIVVKEKLHQSENQTVEVKEMEGFTLDETIDF